MSFIWKYFDKAVRLDPETKVEKARVVCKVCKGPDKQEYVYDGSTVNMKYHLTIYHKITNDDKQNMKIDSFLSNKNITVSNEDFSKALIKFIIMTKQPLTFTNNDYLELKIDVFLLIKCYYNIVGFGFCLKEFFSILNIF